MRGVGIFKSTYCSRLVVVRLHWSSLEDWMYSLTFGLLVEIKREIDFTNDLYLPNILYGLRRGGTISAIVASSETYEYSIRFSIFDEMILEQDLGMESDELRRMGLSSCVVVVMSVFPSLLTSTITFIPYVPPVFLRWL
ncbi:unnamed protein product [Lupinus luteus]|uniref:Uncharacterized protein n=1 Tax=Lupinus luteus TaxID=3873 RepID=A0AAV1WL68_LUPLU